MQKYPANGGTGWSVDLSLDGNIVLVGSPTMNACLLDRKSGNLLQELSFEEKFLPQAGFIDGNQSSLFTYS